MMRPKIRILLKITHPAKNMSSLRADRMRSRIPIPRLKEMALLVKTKTVMLPGFEFIPLAIEKRTAPSVKAPMPISVKPKKRMPL